MRAGTPKCPEIQDWLASSLPAGSRVGIDPFLHTVCAPAPALGAASACDYPPALSHPAQLGKYGHQTPKWSLRCLFMHLSSLHGSCVASSASVPRSVFAMHVAKPTCRTAFATSEVYRCKLADWLCNMHICMHASRQSCYAKSCQITSMQASVSPGHES